MSLAPAIDRLESFLMAGLSYENRGGRHDPIDDDIRIGIDALQWANHPDLAEAAGTERDDPESISAALSGLREFQDSGPLGDDIKLLVAAMGRAGITL